MAEGDRILIILRGDLEDGMQILEDENDVCLGEVMETSKLDDGERSSS